MRALVRGWRDVFVLGLRCICGIRLNGWNLGVCSIGSLLECSDNSEGLRLQTFWQCREGTAMFCYATTLDNSIGGPAHLVSAMNWYERAAQKESIRKDSTSPLDGFGSILCAVVRG